MSDLVALDEAGIDRRQLAVRAADLSAKMIFDDGYFHADPHPGNLFIEPDGRIGLIDFGMVGEVDDVLQGKLGVLLVAVTREYPDRLTAALLNLAADHGPVDRAQLRAQVVPIIAMYRGCTLGKFPLGNLIREILKVLRIHHLRLPREMALLLKMILMAEAMGVHLDAQFRLGEVLAPYASRLSEKLVSPTAIARQMAQAGIDISQLLSALPDQLRRLQAVFDAGGPEVHLRAAELEPLVTRIEAMSKRVVVAMIAAALIRGVGELIAINPTRWKSRQMPLMSGGCRYRHARRLSRLDRAPSPHMAAVIISTPLAPGLSARASDCRRAYSGPVVRVSQTGLGRVAHDGMRLPCMRRGLKSVEEIVQ